MAPLFHTRNYFTLLCAALPSQGVPVWVCTTNDGLDSVLQHSVPLADQQQQQLIFVQNGMLLPWLRQHGLQDNTQVLLYMSGEQSQ